MTRFVTKPVHKPVKAVLDANLFFTMWIIDPLLTFAEDPHDAYAAISRLIGAKQHPPRTMDGEINTLQRLGMHKFAQRLSGYERR